MRTGENGQIALRWSQTELDGLDSPPLEGLVIGAAWSWRGACNRFAAVHNVIVENSRCAADTHPGTNFAAAGSAGVLAEVEFSNGAQIFVAHLVRHEKEEEPLIVFPEGCPPRERDFWVSAISQKPMTAKQLRFDENVVAFPSPSVSSSIQATDLAQVAVGAAE